MWRRPVHRCRSTCTWTGSTGQGYAASDRSHVASALPSRADLRLSADPAFLGDPARLNREQLLLVSASSCQLLSFLAIAFRAHVDVVAYEDEAIMPELPRPARISEIVLRPVITVRGPLRLERVEVLVEVAHRECFIANSLRPALRTEPVVQLVDHEGDPGGTR